MSMKCKHKDGSMRSIIRSMGLIVPQNKLAKLKQDFPKQKIILFTGGVGTGKTTIANGASLRYPGSGVDFLDRVIIAKYQYYYNYKPDQLIQMFDLCDIFTVDTLPNLNDPQIILQFHLEFACRNEYYFSRHLEATEEIAEHMACEEMIRRQNIVRDNIEFNSDWVNASAPREAGLGAFDDLSFVEGISAGKNFAQHADVILQLTTEPLDYAINSVSRRQNIPHKIVEMVNSVVEAKNIERFRGEKIIQLPNNAINSLDEDKRDYEIDDIVTEAVRHINMELDVN